MGLSALYHGPVPAQQEAVRARDQELEPPRTPEVNVTHVNFGSTKVSHSGFKRIAKRWRRHCSSDALAARSAKTKASQSWQTHCLGLRSIHAINNVPRASEHPCRAHHQLTDHLARNRRQMQSSPGAQVGDVHDTSPTCARPLKWPTAYLVRRRGSCFGSQLHVRTAGRTSIPPPPQKSDTSAYRDHESPQFPRGGSGHRNVV